MKFYDKNILTEVVNVSKFTKVNTKCKGMGKKSKIYRPREETVDKLAKTCEKSVLLAVIFCTIIDC